MGVVVLAPGAQDILVGMAFLRQFKLGILMTSGLIVLLDEDEVQRFSESERGKGEESK